MSVWLGSQCLKKKHMGPQDKSPTSSLLSRHIVRHSIVWSIHFWGLQVSSGALFHTFHTDYFLVVCLRALPPGHHTRPSSKFLGISKWCPCGYSWLLDTCCSMHLPYQVANAKALWQTVLPIKRRTMLRSEYGGPGLLSSNLRSNCGQKIQM